MVSLANFSKHFFETYGNEKRIWIAFSGGIDSHVLLHLLADNRSIPSDLNVIHINHNISPNADVWQQHCLQVCEDLKINFHAKKIENTFQAGESLEALLRKKRYALLKELLAPGEILLTAHQQDDQAETLLMQLFRGAGPKGLSSMPVKKKLGQGWHIRPLLNFSRHELYEYAIKNQLNWIEDESNNNTKFSRNFIRHDVLPILKKRWPNVTQTISRAAKHCGDMQDLLEARCTVIPAKAGIYRGNDSVQDNKCFLQGESQLMLSVSTLLQLNPLEQTHALRNWLSQNNIPLPSEKKLFHLQKDLLSANQDKNPHITWGEYEARRYQDLIYVMPQKLKHDSKQIYTWDLVTPLLIERLGILNSVPATGNGFRTDIQQVTVRFRQGGERLQLPGRAHTHCLKKMFQEWKIPPWERDRIPLIFVENELAAVVGFFIADKYAAQPNEPSYNLMSHIS